MFPAGLCLLFAAGFPHRTNDLVEVDGVIINRVMEYRFGIHDPVCRFAQVILCRKYVMHGMHVAQYYRISDAESVSVERQGRRTIVSFSDHCGNRHRLIAKRYSEIDSFTDLERQDLRAFPRNLRVPYELR